MKRVIVLRHLAFEDLGVFESEFLSAGHRPIYLDAGLHSLGDVDLEPSDLLVILGGPIGADEEEMYPILKDEFLFLETALSKSVPVLGICLGAQMIARVFGAHIKAMPQKEIGFGKIELTDAGKRSCLGPIEASGSHVLHWHGDTFDLPKDADLLASSPMAENQAFSVGERVLGLQFHLELDPKAFERWLIGHTCELRLADIDVTQLRADAIRYSRDLETGGRDVIRRWLSTLSPN